MDQDPASLGSILRGIADRSSRRTITPDKYGTAPAEPEPAPAGDPNCAVCDGAGWISRYVPVDHQDFGEAFPCSCQPRPDPERSRSSRLQYADPRILEGKQFARLNPNGVFPDLANQARYQAALEQAKAFAQEPQGWLTLAGAAGSGKTTLALAIVNAALDQNLPALYISLPDLLDHLRSAYNPQSEFTYDQLSEQVKNSKLLVLDDLSVQQSTPWAHEKLLQIMNHRFIHRLPTVLAVAGSVNQLDERTRRRLETPDGANRLVQLTAAASRLPWSAAGKVPTILSQQQTFERFQTWTLSEASPQQQAELEQVKTAAQEFARAPSGWLMLSGPRGSGKTHLAAAISAEAVKWGQDPYFTFLPDLLSNLRAGFDPNSELVHHDLLERVKYCDLLILDDLDLRNLTPWSAETLYLLLNVRELNLLPTVITSVFTPAELESANSPIGSRLSNQRIMRSLILNAPDYRKRAAS